MKPKGSALRYFGGKWRIAPWIVGHFPDHRVYVEPYGGGASVLLTKPRSYAEVYNDLDGEIVNVFRVLRDDGPELMRLLALTPYARAEFEQSMDESAEPVEQARRTICRSYMGHGSTMTRLTKKGRLMRTGFRTYTGLNRRGLPVHDWMGYPDRIRELSERFAGVIVENRPALEVMRRHDCKEALHYLDPCYLHQTRGRPDGYRHEMTDRDHVDLAVMCHSLKGQIVISGYRSKLYDKLYRDWRTEHRRVMADGAKPRIETLWMNY